MGVGVSRTASRLWPVLLVGLAIVGCRLGLGWDSRRDAARSPAVDDDSVADDDSASDDDTAGDDDAMEDDDSVGDDDLTGDDDYGQDDDVEMEYWSEFAVGYFHTCAISNQVYGIRCWGDDRAGQSSPPGGTLWKISAGMSHTCGLDPEGTVHCWGCGDGHAHGQCGEPDGPFEMVSAGRFHTCGLRPDGAIECWGCRDAEPKAGGCECQPASDDEFAGRADFGQCDVPEGTYESVSAGGYHTCALGTDGSVVCWGCQYPSVDDGQCVHATGPHYGITAGDRHTCISASGGLICYGANEAGQAAFPWSRDAAEAVAGVYQTCVAGGPAICRGCATEATDFGQCDVPEGYHLDQVDAGYAHTCGLEFGGDETALACWGCNDPEFDFGQCDVPP